MKALTDTDFKEAADSIGCTVAVVKAVKEVESNGKGFLPDGQPAILFEAHKFSEFTNGQYDRSHPTISSSRWNKRLYKGGVAEHVRLVNASALNRDAALKSASWGLFQIMGFNWRLCGYSSLQAFINAMYRSEGEQLKAFIGFVKSQRLDRHLRNLNWAKFAEGYNGSAYKENKYDTKLAAAYKKYLN